MSQGLKRGRVLGVAAGLLFVLLAGAVLVQFLRPGWPFDARESPGSDKEHRALSHAASRDAHAAHAPLDSEKRPLPMGYAPVTVDPARTAALQIQTVPVEDRMLTKSLRTVGIVALDETRTVRVHVKVQGWIDTIYANFVGRSVQAGEPLCLIYSQDVYSTELEYLSILDRALGRSAPDPMLDAARRRLSLWDVPRSEVARLESTREARRTFPLLARQAGTVIAKEAIAGMYVDPSTELYTVSDLSRVWVLADVYERDVPYVHMGDKARLTLAGSDAPIEAAVAFLYPTVEEASRTRKVRFLVDNRKRGILPGAFASVTMDVSLGKGLAIPESAVLRTGPRSLVFVAQTAEGTHLEPREVRLGPLVGDLYPVEAGLQLGEHVAVSALFLLDSESRMQATSTAGGGHAHAH